MARRIATIHEGGTTEVQWSQEGAQEIEGYILVHEDGTLTVPFRAAGDEPFVFVLDRDGGRVVAGEDQPPREGDPIVWNADTSGRVVGSDAYR